MLFAADLTTLAGAAHAFLEVVRDLIWPLPVLARQSIVHKFYFRGFTLAEAVLKVGIFASGARKKFRPPPFAYLGGHET